MQEQFGETTSLEGSGAAEAAVPTLTRERLALSVTESCGVGRRQAKVLVESIFDAMVQALRAGDTIQIRGLGTFKSRARQSRMSRNPRSGITIRVPKKRVIVFKASRQITHGECEE